jgi:hypothetical protein
MAGAGRSRYLQARDRLVRRGLGIVEAEASGRGRSSTFAASGPWWEGEINVELLEAVLSYSAATGVARLLGAAIADARHLRRVERALSAGAERPAELIAAVSDGGRSGRSPGDTVAA